MPELQQVSLKDLIPYARNARTHSDQQVAEIAASIREFGFNNPVLLRDDNTIIAGHGRVLAARKLGLADVPCIYLSHLTEAQARAYVLADNQLATHAGWEAELLRLELDDLQGLGFDPEVLGFSLSDLGAFDVDGALPPALSDGDRAPFRQVTFTLHDEQFEEVEAALALAKKAGGGESAVNENTNGNALAFICTGFNRGKS